MTPIQIIALSFVAERNGKRDPATGRRLGLRLGSVSEPMRARIVDLAMMEPPMLDVDGDELYVTIHGSAVLRRLKAETRCPTGIFD